MNNHRSKETITMNDQPRDIDYDEWARNLADIHWRKRNEQRKEALRQGLPDPFDSETGGDC
jgi:hypothetical protein